MTDEVTVPVALLWELIEGVTCGVPDTRREALRDTLREWREADAVPAQVTVWQIEDELGSCFGGDLVKVAAQRIYALIYGPVKS